MKDVDKRTGIDNLQNSFLLPPFTKPQLLPLLTVPCRLKGQRSNLGSPFFSKVANSTSCKVLARNIRSHLNVYYANPLYEFNYTIVKLMSQDIRDVQQKPHMIICIISV